MTQITRTYHSSLKHDLEQDAWTLRFFEVAQRYPSVAQVLYILKIPISHLVRNLIQDTVSLREAIHLVQEQIRFEITANIQTSSLP